VFEKKDHVLQRFPEHDARIRARMAVDDGLRSLCEDYAETVEALHRWQASTGPYRDERVTEFQHLLLDLESELLAEVTKP
jgi:hypothetical protein